MRPFFLGRMSSGIHAYRDRHVGTDADGGVDSRAVTHTYRYRRCYWSLAPAKKLAMDEVRTPYSLSEDGDMTISQTSILLVDDESPITTQLKPFLERAGYAVTVAGDGDLALRRVSDVVPDLVILDVDLPKLSGIEVCRRLRNAGNWTPIIMLTKFVEAADRTMGLNEVADDYVDKPYDPYELEARVRAVLRRARPGTPPPGAGCRLACGPMLLDRVRRRVLLSDRELPLTPKAVGLLDYLMTHPHELLTRERLLDEVWSYYHPAAMRAVDQRVSELSKHLGDDPAEPLYIETVVGQGYVFVGQVEVVP